MKIQFIITIALLLSATLLQAQTWTEHTLNGSYTRASSVYAVDLDGDGDMDILGTSYQLDDITWWENDGNENFTQWTIDGSANGAYDVYAADIDGDGDLDVVGVSYADDFTAWWKNDGTPNNNNWTKYQIDNTDHNGASSVYAADMDGDGDMDVLSTSSGTGVNDITWWENDGTPEGNAWPQHSLSSTFNGARSVFATDLDGDGDMDVLGAASSDNDITWWENNGSQSYTQHTIDGNFLRAYSVFACDLDGDGDIDVLGAARLADDITWWRNDGSENFTKITIDGNFDDARSVYAADVDGDGDMDVLGAAYGHNDIALWKNDGSENFTKTEVDYTFGGACSVYAADIDDDGNMDVLGAAYGAADITWWENGNTPTATASFTDGSGFTPSVTLGSANQAIGRFQLTSTANFGFVAAEIKLNGTRTGLSNFKLWQSSDNSFSSSSDIQLGNVVQYDPGDGKTVSFYEFASPISTSGTYYFLTADYASGATGSILGVLVNNPNLEFSGGTLSSTISNAALSTRSGVTWDGSTDSNWSTATNWVGDAVPTSANDVIIADVTNDPVIGSSTNASCYSLTINSGATLTINSTSETASGSLIVSGTSSGDVTYERWMTDSTWHIVSSPVETQDIGDLLDNSANSIAYRDRDVDTFAVTDYLENINAWGTYYTSGTVGDFTNGIGYLMRRDTTDGTVSFTGTVADADFTVSLDSTDHAWNALGNPFTSAMNANSTADGTNNLISVNISNNAIDDSYAALYIWDEQPGYTYPANQYKVINHAKDDLAQNYIQAGQGFIVKAKTNNVTFSFTRAMQTHQTDAPFKSAKINGWADINIIVANNEISIKTKLKFNDQMTDGLDVGYDAGILKGNPDFNLFTQLAEDNGVEFMLQCLPLQNLETLEIPIGLDATDGGEISFSIEKNNFTESVIPVLNDKLLDEKFSFTSDGDIYTTTINDNTKGFGRFSLTFASTTDAENIASEKQHFKAWFSNGKINLYGETTGSEIVRVYNISGQEISNTRLENTNLNTIELPVRISGIYLIRIEKQSGTEVLKVPVLFD